MLQTDVYTGCSHVVLIQPKKSTPMNRPRCPRPQVPSSPLSQACYLCLLLKLHQNEQWRAQLSASHSRCQRPDAARPGRSVRSASLHLRFSSSAPECTSTAQHRQECSQWHAHTCHVIAPNVPPHPARTSSHNLCTSKPCAHAALRCCTLVLNKPGSPIQRSSPGHVGLCRS